MAAAFLLVLFSGVAHGAEALTMYQVVLLQSNTLFEKRVASADALAAYIKAVNAGVKTTIDSAEPQPPASGFFVIALRPGQRSNAWLDFDPPLPEAISKEIIAKIRSIMPIRVKEGPVAFAVKVGLWGGKEPSRNLPTVKEWKAVEKQTLMTLDPDEIVEKIWVD